MSESRAHFITRFNSRTLGRVRRITRQSTELVKLVSIHAPWEGCDAYPADGRYHTRRFQFTHPGKGATKATNITPRMNNVFQFTHPGKGATHGRFGDNPLH